MLEKGLVQVYTGDGRGKTMAAFGLALRAAGQGHTVLIYQFLKPSSLDIGERIAVAPLKSIKIETLNIEWDMAKSPHDPKAVSKVKSAIHESLEILTEAAGRRAFDVLILDELVYCLSEKLANLEDIKKLITARDEHVELVLTGRGATRALIDMADLVTEMKNVKHPFDKGAAARRGIEF